MVGKVSLIRIVSTVVGLMVYSIVVLNNFFQLKKINLRIASFVIGQFVNDFDEIFDIRFEYDPVKKRQVHRLILNIPSYGCSYYFKNGGCAMCGFNNEIKKYRLREFSQLSIRTIVYSILSLAEQRISQEKIKVDTLMIFMAGSFINEEELPIATQNLVLKFFKKSCINNLYIELRPEFAITKKDRLLKIVNEIKPKKLQVALGLESSNDYVRNKLIKKNVSKKTYVRAVKILKTIGVKVFTYLLIGIPFRSVREIEKDALASAIFAWESGSDVINLEIYCVQAGTTWEEYYLNGQLKLLSLWSIFRIIKHINDYSEDWYLGSFSDSPKPLKVPENCSRCNDVAKKIFNGLVKDHDINLLEKMIDCSCGSF